MSYPSDPNAKYPPPGGPPPPGAPPGPTPHAPYGGYAPPPAPPGQPGYYPPPSQYYPPPPPTQYPASYPTGSYYAPPPGPSGQYPPYGSPPPGAYGAPSAGAYPPGAPPSSQYPPPTGAPPAPLSGSYLPPLGPPPGWNGPTGGYGVGQVAAHGPAAAHPPVHTSGYPGAPAAPSPYPPTVVPTDPLVYLETHIPNPTIPPAAHGAQKVPGWDPAHDYNAVQRAMLVNPVNEVQLTRVLRPLTVFQMDALNDYTVGKEGNSLSDKVERKTSGNYGFALRALTLGPLGFDVELARRALAGMGTNEFLLIELILGRPGPEIRWLKTGYRLRYGKDLMEAVKSDMSGKLERMFVMALNTQKPANEPYIDYARVEADVETLNNAGKKRDEGPFFEILINRSNVHLGSIVERFGAKYKSLSKVIKKAFSGIIEKALLYIVHGVKPKRDRQGIWRDAKLLEASMAGLGTKDIQLVYRLVRAHWNPSRMEAIKQAYKNRYNKTLESRVKGETSGPYRELLIEIIRASEGPKK